MVDASEQTDAVRTNRWVWLVVGVGFLTCWLFDGIIYSFGIYLDTLVAEFNSSKAAVSWVGSIPRGTIQIAGIVVGPLTRHLDCSTVAVIGCFVGSIAFFISSYAMNVIYLYFTFGILLGFFASMALLTSVISATLIFKKHRGLAVGIITAGGGTGLFAISPFSTWLMNKWGTWRWVFRLYALAVLCLVPIAAVMRPQSPIRSAIDYCQVCHWLCKACTCEYCKHRCLRPSKEPDTASIGSHVSGKERIPMASLAMHPSATHGSTDTITKKPGHRFAEAFRQPRLYFICLAGFLVSLGIFTPPTYIISYAITWEINALDAAFLNSFIGINNTVSRILIGWFIDIKVLNFLVIYIAGTLLGGVATLIFWNFNNYPVFLVYAGVYGVGMGCNLSMRSIVLVELMGPELFHEIFGIYLVCTGVAALVGPPIAGYVLAVTKNYATVFAVAGGFMTSGCLVWAVIPWIR